MAETLQKKARHVVPNATGGWDVREAGVLEPIGSFETQKQAVAAAKQISQSKKTMLYEHREDGSISAVHNYESKRGGK